ncbi:MAG TPA: response regulator [Candidatus Saccharimonadales bacterium]|nr:response regulator [Candidatus Saccharimonadales bacterium]
MKILIVDDSAFMRTILKNLVPQTKWGSAAVLEAANGDEAITLCQTEKPDLVLLDIVMPGKDGIAVLQEIGFTAPSVVMVSSMGQDTVIEQAKSLGAKDYIVKPFDAKLVIDSLNKLYPASATPETPPQPAAPAN